MASMLLLFHSCPDPSSSASRRRHRHLATTTLCPSPRLCSHFGNRRATLPPLCCASSSAALLTADPLQAPSTSLPFSYAPPPPETDDETKLAAETFLASEQSDIASAAAGAVALAREAAEMAKNAVEIVRRIDSTRRDRNSDSVPSETDLSLMERVRLTEMEFPEKSKHFDASNNTDQSKKIMQASSAEGPNFESEIASAAVSLAREAADMAKNSVEIVRRIDASRHDRNSDNVLSETDILLMERLRLTEMEFSEKIKHFDASNNTHQSEEIMQASLAEAPDFQLADTEYEVLEAKYSNRIRVNSTRRSERRARRSRAAAKMSANVLCMKSTSPTRRKRASLQESDYSDPLRYLFGITSTSKLLTAAEELELSKGIQDLLKLEKLQEELAERYGSQPTFAQWASAAKTDQKTLRKRLNHGIFCKDKMIKSNIRLVISIAKKFQGTGMNLQDIVQEGCRGLEKGAEKFDASRGFKFSTYAHWWIKQYICKSLSNQSRTIRLPLHMVDATYRIKEARKQLYSETGRYPNNEEIAEMTGLSMKRIEAVLLIPKAPKSLEQKIGISQNLKPSEVIADPDAETAEDLLTKQLMKQDLDKVLDSLNSREKQVISWRFGLQDGRMKTLQEIGDLMGVSRERIRQIESCAFRKLKNKKKNNNLKKYLIS